MPTPPTVNVTVNVVDASGAPVFGAAIVFRLNRLATVNGIAVPTNVVALTDAAGVAVVPLCPNALCGGSYAVRVSASGVDSKGVAVIPNEDCLLDSVFQSVPYPEQTYVEAALAEISGVTASITASTTTATTAATTATTQAGLATTAAGTATSAAGTATSAADTATAKAAEASGFSDSAEGYSQDAEAARDTAVGAVASLNLPVLMVSDAGKYLQVDPEGDGYVASAVATPVPTQITNAGFGVWSNGTLESAVSSVNLITNGEEWTGASGSTPPASWSQFGSPAQLLVTGNTGTNALLITNNGSTRGGNSQAVTTIVGHVYKASCYIKAGTTYGAIIAGTVAGGFDISYFNSPQTSWARCEIIFEAIGTTTYISTINGNVSGGTAYYDSITLYDMGANLVANGTFNNGTSEWINGASNTISSVAGGINGNCGQVSNTEYGYTYQQITDLTIGKLYRISAFMKNGSAIGPYLGIDYIAGPSGSITALNPTLSTVTSFTFFSSIFEATSTSIYINLQGLNVGTYLFDSITLTEVTVGCVDYNTKALDLWTKDLAAVCFRETINTKAGSYYALRVYNGAVYWSDGGRAAKPEFYSKYAGRPTSKGMWVRCSSANKARIGITDSAGTTWSSYHSGGGSYEWLEVTRTSSTGITSFYVALDSGTGTEAQFSQPQLMFGNSVGAGNFVPIPGEYIALETGIITQVVQGNLSTQAASVLNPRVDSLGRIPKFCKRLFVNLNVNEAVSTSNGGSLWGVFFKSSVNSPMCDCISPFGLANGYGTQKMVTTDCSSDGTYMWWTTASGSGTLHIASALQYTGVQL